MNELAQVYHESHVARAFPKSRISKNTGIPKQHSRDCHIEYSTIVLSQNTQLGLAEYELPRNSYAISQQFTPENLVSRDGSAVPSRVSLLVSILSRLNLVLISYYEESENFSQ